MKHIKPVNQKASQIEHAVEKAKQEASQKGQSPPEVQAYAPSPLGCIANIFNPGWETDCAQLETTRWCPGHAAGSYHEDLKLCWPGCWWPAQVPDQYNFPDWLRVCSGSNIFTDWQKLCFVPDIPQGR